MPLNQSNCRTFTRKLFAGQLRTITLLKRDDDQREGVVTSYVLYECRRSLITKSGEPLAGDMSVDYRTVWHIPRRELDRVGVNYINVLDRIVDNVEKITWQPEAQEEISNKLFSNEIDIQCVRRK